MFVLLALRGSEGSELTVFRFKASVSFRVSGLRVLGYVALGFEGFCFVSGLGW